MLMNALNPQKRTIQEQFGVPHNINANVQLAIPLYNPQVYGAIQNTQIAKELIELQFQKSEEQVFLTLPRCITMLKSSHINWLFWTAMNTEKLLKEYATLERPTFGKRSDVSKVKLQAEQLNTQRQNVNNKLIQVLMP